MSPAANTSGCDVDCRVSPTATKPEASSASPTPPSHPAGLAWVAQKTSSSSIGAILSISIRRPSMDETRASVRISIPRSSRIRSRRLRAPTGSDGTMDDDPDSSVISSAVPSPPTAEMSRRNRASSARTSSTPAAPPPTTPMRDRPPLAATRSQAPSKCRRKRSIGLTGMACRATSAISIPPGVDPMSIDRRSKATAGRPSQIKRRLEISKSVTSE